MPEAAEIRAWVTEHRADLGPFLDAVREEMKKEATDYDHN